MKFILTAPLRDNIYNLLRDAGYHFQPRSNTPQELEFTRPRSGYPRFHLFAAPADNAYSCTLHLDQKKPVYQGSSAHSGEYDGAAVVAEAERIRKIVCQ